MFLDTPSRRRDGSPETAVLNSAPDTHADKGDGAGDEHDATAFSSSSPSSFCCCSSGGTQRQQRTGGRKRNVSERSGALAAERDARKEIEAVVKRAAPMSAEALDGPALSVSGGAKGNVVESALDVYSDVLPQGWPDAGGIVIKVG